MSPSDIAVELSEVFKGHSGFYVENNSAVNPEHKTSAKVESKAFFKKEPVTDGLYLQHVKGIKGLGICPINEDGQCFFGAIDIDMYGVDHKHLINLIYDNEIPLLPCRTKSGGLHLYFLVKKAVKASSMIDALENFVSVLGMRKIYISNGDDKVEIFPKQKKLIPGKQGNCITIPYFRSADPAAYLYSAAMEKVEADEAVEMFKKSRSTISELDEAIEKLRFSDAPKCIQTMALMNCLGENSGRNNYLFTASVYLKKKYGDDFKGHLEELNSMLSTPLEDGDIESMYESVKTNEYNYKCGDNPCKFYCNPSVCSKREYGVGKDKGGHFTGLDYGKLTRMMSEDPYYIWELRIQSDDDDAPYKKVIFKNEGYLIDQINFAKLCVRYLNRAPTRIADNEWYKILNTVLLNVIEVAVAIETDTSEGAEVKNAFLKYLTQKPTPENAPYLIKVSLVCLKDGKYYFTTEGFQSYLKAEKVKLGSLTLREVLLSYGVVEDKLVYATKSGKEESITCLSKVADEEVQSFAAYYEDVYNGDTALIEEARAEEEKNEPLEGEVEGDDAMF